MKVALIVLYFGKLPNYFSLFLKSCEVNKDFTWLIFTDDETEFNYPENVKKIDMKNVKIYFNKNLILILH